MLRGAALCRIGEIDMKPAYVCSACAKGFSSARSARRHIRDIENGNGAVYTEAQYRVMLLTGEILPPFPRLSRPSFSKKEPDPYEIATDEFVRGFFRRLGENAVDKRNKSTKEFSDVFLHDLLRRFSKAI